MDGIIVVDKPRGITSHDVVDIIRRRFGLKKVGHAGTLDPIATGVLVMLIGKCTKSSHALMKDDKEYEATLTFGAVSDTGDAEGRLTYSEKRTDFSNEELERAFNKFIGDIEQTPPAFSAVKINGRKAYELARKGIRACLKPRKVSIKELEILSIGLPEVRFRVKCSKGTYIRQLAADIGKALGCGAYVSQLRRTKSGRFSIENALTIDDLKKLDDFGLKRRLLTPSS